MSKEVIKNKLLKQLKLNEFLKQHRLSIYFAGATALMLASLPGMVLDSILLTWIFYTPAILLLVGGGLDVYAVGNDRFINKKEKILTSLEQLGYNVSEVIGNDEKITIVVKPSQKVRNISQSNTTSTDEDKLVKLTTKRVKEYIKNTNETNEIGI